MSAGLSKDQRQVLAALSGASERLRVIEIIQATRSTEMRHATDPSAYRCAMASTSRTLTRLHARGLVDYWRASFMCRQGKGGWWSITAAGREAVNMVTSVNLVNRCGREAVNNLPSGEVVNRRPKNSPKRGAKSITLQAQLDEHGIGKRHAGPKKPTTTSLLALAEQVDDPTDFVCPVCQDRFDESVWHCLDCHHHWTMDRRYCATCHKAGSPDGPLRARKRTSSNPKSAR